jgi:hypothetical protein
MIFIIMSRNKEIGREVQKFVEQLPNEQNFLIKYNYVLSKLDERILDELTIYHLLNKNSDSILGLMIENAMPEVGELFEVTFFEVLDDMNQEICMFLDTDVSIKIQYLDKVDLFQEILPILNGNEKLPFKVFK